MCDIIPHMKPTREVLNARQRLYKSKESAKQKRRAYDRKRLENPEVVARMKAYRQSEKGKEVLRKANVKLRSTEEYKKKAREYKKSEKYKNWRRNNDFKKKFGISLVDYNNMQEAQNGLCAICSNPETFSLKGTVHSLAVDHCHKTGNIRGLLCRMCNQMLGLAKDDVSILTNAVKYLNKCL